MKNMCKLNEKYSTPSQNYTNNHSSKSLKFKSLPISEKNVVTSSNKIGQTNNSDVKHYYQTIVLEKNSNACTTTPIFSNIYSTIQKKESLKSVNKEETISTEKCIKSNSTIFSTNTKKTEESSRSNFINNSYLNSTDQKNNNDVPLGNNQNNIFAYSSINNCHSCKEDITVNLKDQNFLLNKKRSIIQNKKSRNTEHINSPEFLSFHNGKNKNENCLEYCLQQNRSFPTQNKFPCIIKSENKIDFDHQYTKKRSYETKTKDDMNKSK